MCPICNERARGDTSNGQRPRFGRNSGSFSASYRPRYGPPRSRVRGVIGAVGDQFAGGACRWPGRCDHSSWTADMTGMVTSAAHSIPVVDDSRHSRARSGTRAANPRRTLHRWFWRSTVRRHDDRSCSDGRQVSAYCRKSVGVARGDRRWALHLRVQLQPNGPSGPVPSSDCCPVPGCSDRRQLPVKPEPFTTQTSLTLLPA
jgi:hypothetical protein